MLQQSPIAFTYSVLLILFVFPLFVGRVVDCQHRLAGCGAGHEKQGRLGSALADLLVWLLIGFKEP